MDTGLRKVIQCQITSLLSTVLTMCRRWSEGRIERQNLKYEKKYNFHPDRHKPPWRNTKKMSIFYLNDIKCYFKVMRYNVTMLWIALKNNNKIHEYIMWYGSTTTFFWCGMTEKVI